MLDLRSPDPRVLPAEKARQCRNQRARTVTHHRRCVDPCRRLFRERSLYDWLKGGLRYAGHRHHSGKHCDEKSE